MIRNQALRKLSHSKLSIALLLVVWLGAAEADADRTIAETTNQYQSRFDPIRDLLLRRVNEDIPSFAISVIHDGKVLWEQAYGWADIDKQIPATTHSLYAVYSVAKSVTSTGVLLLAAQGNLGLDDPISKYVSAGIVTPLATAGREATVRDLLNMTAGFPMGFMSMVDTAPRPDRDLLLQHHGGIQVFPPGEIAHYANFSLGVAEIVIERAAGKSFNNAMQELLFRPAGMKSTVYSGYETGITEVVTNYDAANQPWPRQYSLPAGGAGLYSSVSDLRKYAITHLGDGDKGSTLRQLQDLVKHSMQHKSLEDSNRSFRSGWGVLELGEGSNLLVSDGHGNGMALVQILPQANLAVICVMSTRKNDPDGQPLTNKIADLVFEEILPGFSEKKNQARAKRNQENRTNPTAWPDPAVVGVWRGYIRLFDESQVAIQLEIQPDGDIHIEIEDQYVVLLNEARYNDNVLDGWFPAHVPVDFPFEQIHDVAARIHFDDNHAHGYLNSNFADNSGSRDLSSFVYLERIQE